MENKIVKIIDIPINALSKQEAILRIKELIDSGKKSQICTVNSEFLNQAFNDNQFKDLLKKSSLNLADGFGVLWSAKFLQFKKTNSIQLVLAWLISIIRIPLTPNYFTSPIPERISGSDFVWDIAKFAADNQIKMFLLGGDPTIAERAALQMQTKIPGLRISGVHSGDPAQTPEIIESINKSKAAILLVAYGSPKQEYWINENLKKTNSKIALGVGGTFDFIAGVKKRAPLWMQKSGLEWVYRLIKEPKRIVRQLSIPVLMIQILIYKLKSNE